MAHANPVEWGVAKLSVPPRYAWRNLELVTVALAVQKAGCGKGSKLYRSIIEDVIEGVRELFAEEGLEEQVLADLKQLWETKVIQSKATEGFFRHNHPAPQFTLQLPQSFHRILQSSAASLVIPTGRGFHHFTAADVGDSQVAATLAVPPGVAYPIHVPAGVTLQAVAGQLYKVNVPVMVAQTSGAAGILQQPVQQILPSLGQPTVLQASAAQANAPSGQAAAETLQPQEAAAQHTVVFQASSMERNHLESSACAMLVQQPSVSQQQPAANSVLNQCVDSDKSQHTAVLTPDSSKEFAPAESLASNSSDVLLDVGGQLDIEPQDLVEEQVSDDIIDLIIMGKGLGDDAVLKYPSIASSGKMEPTEQVESNLQSEEGICSGIEDIIQLDGTGDASPKGEIQHAEDREENEFIGIIESEDLKVLEDEEDDDEDCDSISNAESNGSGRDNEEPQTDIVEEDPLNSGDDVSEQDTPDLFDTDNVIVCQYDKIHRSKNKWKFFLKDGVMSFEGKDHVFAKAIGDAEW